MSSNRDNKEFGNVLHVGIGSNHPEIRKRLDEILEVAKNLTEEEKKEAIFNYSQAKWRKLKNSEPA